jgi:hypothetical protein
MKLFAKCFAVLEALFVCLPWAMWRAALHIDWGFPTGRVLIEFSPYFLPPSVLAPGAIRTVWGVPMPHGLDGWAAVIITYTVAAAAVALVIVGIARIGEKLGEQNRTSEHISEGRTRPSENAQR